MIYAKEGTMAYKTVISAAIGAVFLSSALVSGCANETASVERFIEYHKKHGAAVPEDYLQVFRMPGRAPHPADFSKEFVGKCDVESASIRRLQDRWGGGSGMFLECAPQATTPVLEKLIRLGPMTWDDEDLFDDVAEFAFVGGASGVVRVQHPGVREPALAMSFESSRALICPEGASECVLFEGEMY